MKSSEDCCSNLEELFKALGSSSFILDSIGDAVSIQDRDLRVIHQNRAHKALKGSHAGKFCYEAYQNKQKVCDDCPVVSVFRNGKPHTAINPCPSAHGEKYVEISAYPVNSSGGEVIACIEILRDITAQKIIEKELRDKTSLLETIIESEPECVKLLDAEGRIIRMNRSGLSMIGAESQEQVAGLSAYSLAVAQYRDEFRAMNEAVFQGIPGRLEFEACGLKGGHLWLDTQAVPLRNEEGRIIMSLGITRNMTDYRLAREALRTSEAFIKNVLDSIGEGLIVIDSDYKIISANQAYLKNTGLHIEDVIGRHCHEVSHGIAEPCHLAGEHCPAKVTFHTGEVQHSVHIHGTGDGNTSYVEVRSYPMRDEHGVIVSVIETVTDITVQRKLEEQLRNSQKLEAVGQLAGGIAHDFNNILTAIIGYGNLLQIKVDSADPTRGKIDQIVAAAEKAASLVQGLLAYSRKQIINPRPVNLDHIIANIEKMLSRLIGEDIELTTDLNCSEAFVNADPGQLEQVLMNLVTNARDAMPDGGSMLIRTAYETIAEDFIRAHSYGVPGQYIALSVSDSGTGMDERTRAKIFDPFFTTKEVGKGTGLGLAMVYGIIKQHEGFTEVESSVGKGTMITIYLPVTSFPGEPAAAQESAMPSLGGSETILLAEDDEEIRRLITDVLTKYGYTVIAVSDGADAISEFLLNKDRIQMLLLDVIMPRKNGKAVYDEIRLSNPGIKALFLSGYTSDLLHKNGKLDSDLNFISKPLSIRNLLVKVRQVLDN